MPTNTAMWMLRKGAALELDAAPYTPPWAGEIVVKNHAVAINPIDWLMPLIGDIASPLIKYPTVLIMPAARLFRT